MAVELVRLLDSDFYALSTGDEFKAAFTLWAKAFMQLPAGSLPADDRILAHLSGAGANWPNVKEMALHGWFKCSDGRLYHHTVSEKVLDAWRCRCEKRKRTEAARAARAEQRRQHNQISVTDNATESVTGSNRTEQNGSKKESKEERTNLRLAPAVADAPPPRREIWEIGPKIVRNLTGRTEGGSRQLLGQMLKAANDDCAKVLEVLKRAERDPPAGDAGAWLLAACRFRNGFFAVIEDEGRSGYRQPEAPNPFLMLPGEQARVAQ